MRRPTRGEWVSIALLAGLCLAVPCRRTFAQATQPEKPAGGADGSGPPRAGNDIGQLNPEATAKSFPKRGYSPYAGRNYPTRVYWGDEHVHSSWSADAGGFGCTLDPEAVMRFARGEELKSSLGEPVRLSRPLDWIALTDHSDAMGMIFEIRAGNPALMANPTLKRWHEMMADGRGVSAVMEMIQAQSNNRVPEEIKGGPLAMTIWKRTTAICDAYNEPGKFSAFIGFEWTSNVGGGDNLHRNVIYRDGKEKADQVLPISTFDSENPEDLWKWMEAWEKKTGGSLMAVPHNGNLSNGRMFALTTFAGDPITRAWAEQRARWEPMYEITQIKGDGETHPALSPNDEFANYEKWDKANLAGVPKKPGMIYTEYARQALIRGLKVEKDLGVNPFKFGFLSGTDTHTGLATAEEDNFFGKHTGVEPSPGRWKYPAIDPIKGWQMSAAGWTGVWATENTREAIWDALKRKEAYSTTGPRMLVRFFGGWDFDEADARTRQPAEPGYRKGVPMGGDLRAALAGKVPTFLVAAMKDAYSGNLDRYQIVKGWVDASGKLQEKVYDVAWSGDRKPGPDGKLPPVGNTVDIAGATWTNTIGSPELIAVWKDPDFDPKLRAVYYGRVIEIPTPRWTAYDAKRFGVTMPPEVSMVTQERAYTSPIWYTP